MQKIRITSRPFLYLILALVVLSVLAWVGQDKISNSAMRFERAQWLRAREDEDWQVRSRMAKDLIERKVLGGQNRGQIVELLGSPETYSDTTDQELWYLIREDWEWIDPERIDQLVITMDRNGHATGARINVFRRNAH